MAKLEPYAEWEGGEEHEWEDFLDDVTHLMEGRTRFYGEVKGFGWRNLDGHKWVVAADGSELLNALLPKTECHMRVFECAPDEPWDFKIQNFHHDSPTGNEWYYVRKATDDECRAQF